MKAGILAVAAAVASGVTAVNHAGRRHAHQNYHLERNLLTTAAAEPTCGCTTIYTTITGEPTLYFPPAPTTSSTSSTSSTPVPTTPSTTVAPTPTSSPAPVVPTPFATTCPTTGVYTIPATTITLTSETTVCGATSTSVPAGTHTAGGVTTVVVTATTVVCPYATTTSPEGGVVTSTILTTTYVCPSAGTYTIAPLTTTVSESTVWVYPTPASFAPGTYTQPEVVTTITETDYVVVCPFTSPAPALPATTSAAAPVVVPTTAVVVASSSAVVVAQPSASAGSNGVPRTDHLGSTGDQWGITYTPYTGSEGLCKSESDIKSDLQKISDKGFQVIRVYSTDCGALTYVADTCRSLGLKMILGVFIKDSAQQYGGISGAQAQVTAIVNWKNWDLVDLIVVGNEAIANKYCSASELAAFISSCKSAFSGAGYSGPVTTTETLDIWQANAGTLCGAVDVTGVNLHAFFNTATAPEEAGTLIAQQLAEADKLCANKYAVNLETGWPTYATPMCPYGGAACAGVSEQKAAINSIKEKVGGLSILFSYQNDLWKAPGALGCERSWGLADIFD